MASNLKSEPASPPTVPAKNNIYLKRKSYKAKRQRTYLPDPDSDSDNEPLLKKQFRQPSTASGLRSLVDSSGSDEPLTTATSKVVKKELTAVGVGRVLDDSDDESSTPLTSNKIKATGWKYTSENSPSSGKKSDKYPKQPKQPTKAATTQREWLTKTLDTITSATGNNPAEATPRPRIKPAESRFLNPAEQLRTSLSAAPSPPTPPTTSTAPVHRTADVATQTSPCPILTSTPPATHPTAEAATPPRSSTIIYVEGYPFSMPADPVECFRKVQREVCMSYSAVYIRKRCGKRDRALASPGGDVSEFRVHVGSDNEEEEEEAGLVGVVGAGAGGGDAARGGAGGNKGKGKEGKGKEVKWKEEEDYAAPKD